MSNSISAEALITLLIRSAAGDQLAFRALYDACSPQLFGVLMRILRKKALAEEALQEVFVRVWQRSDQYDSKKSDPMVWMSSIARYHAIDVLRRRHNRENKETAWSPLDSDNVGDPDFKPMDVLLEQEQTLAHCLDQLGDKPRECIIRAYCEGYTAEELAVMLDRPAGTVKSWIRRSLVSLRECIDGLL